MPKVKSQKSKVEFHSGFTLIELMAVISIMVILASVMVLNLAGQRESRDLKIAQNQLVSNLRLIQSYTLSDRALTGGQSVEYYIMKLDSSKPNQYTLQAMYNVTSSPQYVQDIQTITLPQNIRLAATNPVVIDRTAVGVNPAIQTVPAGGCAMVIFAAPFAKTFLNEGCGTIGSSNPYQITDGDDYQKILNFVTNTDCLSSGPPPIPAICSLSTDSNMTITLSNSSGSLSQTVTVNGITGSITSSQ